MRKLFAYAFYFLPAVAFAQDCPGLICNPLAHFQTSAGESVETIPQLLDMLLGILIQVTLPLVAVLIIYSGYLFATAAGDPGKVKKARAMLTYIVVGLGILLASKGIQMALQSTINSLR